MKTNKNVSKLSLQDLALSPVLFDEARHTYSYEGKTLTGVTTLIKTSLFPDKYKDVPEAVLRRAAERGTAIHNLCEEYNIFENIISEDLNKYPELQHYIKLTKDKALHIIANEYLVSDTEHIATMIDSIDEAGNLYDIKTTRELDTDYLSWQLSVGAYLYELQNPKLKAGKLYGIHLRPEGAKLVAVKRKPKTEVRKLIESFVQEASFTPDIVKEQSGALAEILKIEEAIVAFKQQVDELNRSREQAMQALTERMLQSGTKRIETDRLKVTLVEASTRESLDTKALKAEAPELYERYKRTSETKPYIKLSIKSA